MALITGAAGGIGRAAVDVFVEEGWGVLAVDIVEVEGLPSGVEFIQADLGKPEEIEELAAQADKAAPQGLSALVNNAAVQIAKPLRETSVDEWGAQMRVNLRAPYLLARELYGLLVRGKGAIVNVASVHALATSPEIGAYAASKGGLMALTRAMAIEFAPDGIRVNAVLPGAVDTGMLAAGLKRGFSEGRKALEEKILLKRVGEPEEIARAIYFLADNSQSSYISGQPLVVDGGALARLSIE